jgi:antirestriction protein ArdC
VVRRNRAGHPENAATAKPYKGINVVALWAAAEMRRKFGQPKF